MSEATLPDYVEPCPYCNATGAAEQTFTRGCGLGSYRQMSSCPMCGKHESFGRPGPGYIYKATCEPVGGSVVAQIASMRQRTSPPDDIVVVSTPGGGDRLADLFRRSAERVAAMAPEERQAMVEAQRRSFVRAMTTPCEHGELDFETCQQCREKANG